MEKLHNEGIQDELDAWLTFLGCDEPEYIVELINKYPIFKEMYADLYNMCLNVEGVMNMFSKELQILDQNTVKYMIDEMQEELDNIKGELDTANATISNQSKAIADQSREIAAKEEIIAKLQAELKKYQK